MDLRMDEVAQSLGTDGSCDAGKQELFEFVGRLALVSDDQPVDGVVDGLLFLTDSHSLVFWTMDVDGRREIVGLEIMPRDERTVPDMVLGWLAPRVESFRKQLPSRTPLPAALLRQGISYREVLRARGELLDQLARPEIVGFDTSALSPSTGEAAGVTSEEVRRVENLLDAVLYDAAVQANLSPVKRIAEHRCISERTAEGRIARSRAMGFLSPAQGRRAAGGLTDYARDLLVRLEKLDAILTKERGAQDG